MGVRPVFSVSTSLLGPAFALGLALGLGPACFADPGGGSCPAGQEGCPCAADQPADQGCNEGLECNEGTCEAIAGETSDTAGDGDGDTAGDGDGDTAGDGDGDGDTAGDGDGDGDTVGDGDGDGDGDTVGDGDGDPGGCMGPEDCAPDEFCDFPDDFCGELAPGACAPRPNAEDCNPNTFDVTGCDCQIYYGSCMAQAAGVDFKCIGSCC